MCDPIPKRLEVRGHCKTRSTSTGNISKQRKKRSSRQMETGSKKINIRTTKKHKDQQNNHKHGEVSQQLRSCREFQILNLLMLVYSQVHTCVRVCVCVHVCVHVWVCVFGRSRLKSRKKVASFWSVNLCRNHLHLLLLLSSLLNVFLKVNYDPKSAWMYLKVQQLEQKHLVVLILFLRDVSNQRTLVSSSSAAFVF